MNSRPPVPQTGALTRLRYAPTSLRGLRLPSLRCRNGRLHCFGSRRALLLSPVPRTVERLNRRVSPKFRCSLPAKQRCPLLSPICPLGVSRDLGSGTDGMGCGRVGPIVVRAVHTPGRDAPARRNRLEVAPRPLQQPFDARAVGREVAGDAAGGGRCGRLRRLAGCAASPRRQRSDRSGAQGSGPPPRSAPGTDADSPCRANPGPQGSWPARARAPWQRPPDAPRPAARRDPAPHAARVRRRRSWQRRRFPPGGVALR